MKFSAGFSKLFSSQERALLTRQMAALFAVITLLNLGFYWQRAFREASARRHAESIVRGWDGLAWYVWMPAAPAMLLLIRRYPLTKETPGRHGAQLALGSAAIYFVVTNTRYLLRILPNIWLPDALDLPVSWAIYLNTQLDRAPLDFLTYCGLFAATYATDAYSKYRQRVEEVMRLQLQAARLQSELVQAQLAALRGQIQPHFLFNAFNAISTLVRQRKNEHAVEMIGHLGELLRFTMEKVDQPDVSLEQEIAFVTYYLNIERVRFGEKLEVVLEVDPDAAGCSVPNLLLQPLVENAIKHGISKRVSPGQVRIVAQKQRDRLVIEISDDGPESPADASAPASGGGSGIGLRNTRSRLTHVYGSGFNLEIKRRAGGGTTVLLDLPWRRAHSEPLPAVAASS
jgi:two-component system LytT family sensor kinase